MIVLQKYKIIFNLQTFLYLFFKKNQLGKNLLIYIPISIYIYIKIIIIIRGLFGVFLGLFRGFCFLYNLLIYTNLRNKK